MLIKLKGNLGQGSTESTLKTTTLNFELNEVVLEPKGYLTVELYLLERLYLGFHMQEYTKSTRLKFSNQIFVSCGMYSSLKVI